MIIIYETSVTGAMSLSDLVARVHWHDKNIKS